MEEEQDKLLTARDVAFRLRVSTYTLSNWRYAHQGPPWRRLGTRGVRYSLAALNRWLEETKDGEEVKKDG